MRACGPVGVIALFVGCVVEGPVPASRSQAAPIATSTSTATSTATTTATPTATTTAMPTATATPTPTPTPTATATATPGAASGDFYACTADADCVAVPKASCCNNGWREAVNASSVDAYKRSVACTGKEICAMFLVNDTREPECSNASHKCEMVAVDKIQCGGFIKNQHKCPDGYRCELPKMPDMPGACVK